MFVFYFFFGYWCQKGTDWGWTVSPEWVSRCQKRKLWKVQWCWSGGNGFVRPSAYLYCNLALEKLTAPLAIASQTLIIWYERCFFLIFEPGDLVFRITNWLSPTSVLARSIQSPKQRSLYHISIIKSIAVLTAIILEPKVDASTVVCCLDIQTRGVLFIGYNIPVTDQCVNVLQAWSAST